MHAFRRLRGRKALAGLALALVFPLVGCEAQEPPKVIDTTTPAKAPTIQPGPAAEPSAPAK